MATNEEKMKILSMLQDGIINAEQAAQLLDALSSSGEGSKPQPSAGFESSGQKKTGKFFRVRVTDTDSGKTRVNVRLPVGLVGAGLKMGMKFSPEIEGMDQDVLKSFLESGDIGKIVDVYDDNDGEHVEVYIE
jgi:hypothetical protein